MLALPCSLIPCYFLFVYFKFSQIQHLLELPAHAFFFLLLSSVMFLTFMTLHIPPPLSRIFLVSGVLLLDPTVDSYVELSLGFFSLCSASGSQGLVLSSYELFNDCWLANRGVVCLFQCLPYGNYTSLMFRYQGLEKYWHKVGLTELFCYWLLC